MFSIVIPLYNKEHYILEAITSVFNQTYQQFEIIVVDDGSTDSGLKILKTKIARMNEENPEQSDKLIVIKQSNQGVSSARNNGVKIAKYNYIAFLDADDWWDPSFLMEMKVLIEEYPEAGIYGSSFYIVKNRVNHVANVGLPLGFRKGYINYFQTYSNNFCTPFNCSFVVVSKKALYEIGSFNENLKFGEDFDLWTRIALCYMVAYINKPLAYSNQDADITYRAVGSYKIYHPASHTTFNWDHLKIKEQEIPELKKLLDGLRVRSLLQYYLSGKYPAETDKELKKVDFAKQPKYYKRIYFYPRYMVKLFFFSLKIASKFKKYLNA